MIAPMLLSRRRIKVVHLTSVHAATDTRIVHKECATLAEAGYEVVLIAPGQGAALPEGVRHRSVPLPRGRLERFSKTIADVYRAACDERAHIYHFHDPELIGVGIALRARGARVIFDVHEDIPRDIKTKPWLPAVLRGPVSAVAFGILQLVQRAFTAIVPATPSIALGFSHDRTIVVRNYPRFEQFTNGQVHVPFDRRPALALYAGSITVLRGVEQMVAAMADPEMPQDARLLLAGPFEDDALRRRMSSVPGWARVDAPGILDRAALRTAFERARVGLLLFQPAPNHDHAMPQKFFEYLSAGLPVIASDCLQAYREIVDAYHCGILVDPRDVKAIARAMCWLLSNPQQAQAMGERGRTAVRGRYEWESEARNLVRLYAEIA